MAIQAGSDIQSGSVSAFLPRVLGIGTFAVMQALNGMATGDEYTVTDVGPVRMRFVYGPAVWRPMGVQILRSVASDISSAADTTEQILDSFALPAKLLALDAYVLRCSLAYEKTLGNSTSIRLRLGTTGTTADASLNISSSGFISTSTGKSGGMIVYLKRASSTTIKSIGGGGSAGWTNSSSTGGLAVSTVGNFDSANQYLSLTQSNASSDIIKITGWIVELMPA